MNRKVSGVPALYLSAFFALVFLSTLAHAKVLIVGEAKGRPGDELVISIEVDAGTAFTDIDIVPHYDEFSPVLSLVSFTPTADLMDDAFGGGCLVDRCAFYYYPKKKFTETTLLAVLRFKVSDAAESFVDEAKRTVPFDLGISIEGEEPFKETMFTVLAVPEPATYLLTTLGLLLLAIQGRRRSRQSRATARGMGLLQT